MAFCENCGAEIKDSLSHCTNCGAATEQMKEKQPLDTDYSRQYESRNNVKQNIQYAYDTYNHKKNSMFFINITEYITYATIVILTILVGGILPYAITENFVLSLIGLIICGIIGVMSSLLTVVFLGIARDIREIRNYFINK